MCTTRTSGSRRYYRRALLRKCQMVGICLRQLIDMPKHMAWKSFSLLTEVVYPSSPSLPLSSLLPSLLFSLSHNSLRRRVSEYTDNIVPDERLKAKDREVRFCVLTCRTDCITWCLEVYFYIMQLIYGFVPPSHHLCNTLTTNTLTCTHLCLHTLSHHTITCIRPPHHHMYTPTAWGDASADRGSSEDDAKAGSQWRCVTPPLPYFTCYCDFYPFVLFNILFRLAIFFAWFHPRNQHGIIVVSICWTLLANGYYDVP